MVFTKVSFIPVGEVPFTNRTFVPFLKLNKTHETLDQVNKCNIEYALPHPELYNIVHGRPTKSKLVLYAYFG